MRTDVTKNEVENCLKTDLPKGKPADEPKVVLGARRTLQPLQVTAGGDKENLVGAGGRPSMPPNKEKLMVVADLKPSKKMKASEPRRGSTEDLKTGPRRITAEDLTSDEPSAAYWEALAERRRIALADALEENQRLMERIAILEEENSQANSRISLLEEENSQANTVLNEARETISLLTELLNEKDDSTDLIDLEED